jgi:hypothetical protein
LRDVLTGLAALVAVALIALMAGPHFIDWDAQRARAVTLLREQTGIEARIGGTLRLTLLPTPTLDVEKVEFGAADRPLARIARINASLSPTALLTGRLVLTSARVDAPEVSMSAVRAALAEAGGADHLAVKLARIGIDRLDLRRARLTDLVPGEAGAAAGGTYDVVLEAPSLLGPFRTDIRDTAGGREFRAQIGRLENGRARMKGVIEDKALSSRVTLDGWFGLPGLAGRPVFDGAATFNGNPANHLATGQLPFQGAARLTVHTDQAIADPVNITLGSGEGAVQLAGRAFVDLQPRRPRLQARLTTKRVDLVPFWGNLGDVFGTKGGELPFDPALELMLEAVQVPGATIRDVTLKLGTVAGGVSLEALSAVLPGTTVATFARAADAGDVALDGLLSIEAGDLQTLAGWLRGKEGGAALPASAKLRAQLQGDFSRLMISGLGIESTAGNLSGSGVLEGPEAGARILPKLALDLAAERFDARVLSALDPLRPIPGVQLATKLRVDHLVLDQQELGGLQVVLERDGQMVSLKQLRLSGRHGEELSLSGNSADDTHNFTAKLDAERLGDIAQLASAILPGPATAALLRRSALLEPAIAVGNFRVTSRAGEVIWDVALDGRLGGTSLAARTTSAVRGTDLDVRVDGELNNPDGARLAGQLTGIAAAATSIPGRILVKASGNPRRNLSGTVSGSIAGVDLAFDGTVNPFRSVPGEGSFRLSSGDLSLLSSALGGGTPPLQQGLAGTMRGRFLAERGKVTLTGFDARFGEQPASGEISFDLSRDGQVAGQIKMGGLDLSTLLAPALGNGPLLANGNWGSKAFGPPRPPLLSGDLWIEAGALKIAEGLSLQSPQFILRFAPEAIEIMGLEAQHGDGRIGGQLSALRKGDMLELGGRIGFARVPIPVLGGRMAGEFPFSASGGTPYALISSLSGAGKITLDGITVADADPEALGRVVAMPLENLEPINENTVGGILTTELRKGTIQLGGREWPLGLLNGQMRIGGTVADEAGSPKTGISIVPTFQVDLVRRDAEARFSIRQATLAKGWQGAAPEISLVLSSKLEGGEKPRRSLQVASLVNGFLAQAIQRDLERAEAFAADVREREAHLRRQKGDAFRARREQEIREVEQVIAEEAAALQRRAAFAAEQERQRQLLEKEQQAREQQAREQQAREQQARERAEREAAELAARTKARLEEERLRQLVPAPAGGSSPGISSSGGTAPGLPLDLAPKAVPLQPAPLAPQQPSVSPGG